MDKKKHKKALLIATSFFILLAIFDFCLATLPRNYSDKLLADKILRAHYCLVFPFSGLTEQFNRDTLQRDYETVFATPFQTVTIDDYINEKAGHGTLFSMSLRSPKPFELKDPQNYKEVDVDSSESNYDNCYGRFTKRQTPWISTGWHKHNAKSNYDIWVYLDEAKATCEVLAHK